jgi:NAD(P)-dependent dehydrogenase (short-subunit alcohol dehydrogenase family)
MNREPTGHRSILITGASSGFGLLTARRARARGWRVAATARRPEAIELGPSQDLLRLRLDVTDGDTVREAVRAALSEFGVLDAVVNNAGMAVYGMAEEVPEKALRRQLDTNFFGAVAVTRAVLPHMRERREGRLVFVSSDWGRTGIPGYSSYCASKFAMEGWVESLFHEVAGFGIGVTLVEPGAFDTGFAAEVADAAQDPASPYAALHRAVGEGFDEEGRAPTGEPVAEAILRAAAGEEPHLRVPVGVDAMEWSAARFRDSEENFIRQLGRRYGWDRPGAVSREP